MPSYSTFMTLLRVENRNDYSDFKSSLELGTALRWYEYFFFLFRAEGTISPNIMSDT